METKTRAYVYFYSALLASVWFLLTSWIWVYFMNLVVSFPIGLLAFVFWNLGRKSGIMSKGFEVIKYLLLLGVAASIISLVGLLLTN
jgi:phosphoglycerol transferase MdoB-like AlkP superfamily enzyme